MILDFVVEHGESLSRDTTPDAVEANRVFLRRVAIPFTLAPSVVQAVLWSNLAGVARDSERAVDGFTVPRLETLEAPHPADHARLVSKGRLLYEHCMFEISSACVVGFIEHELKKSRLVTMIMLDLLGWMAEQRVQLMTLGAGEPEEDTLGRIEHTDYMIEMGVSYVHGLDRMRARALGAEKEP